MSDQEKCHPDAILLQNYRLANTDEHDVRESVAAYS
mgnify:CR=1 FL=1